MPVSQPLGCRTRRLLVATLLAGCVAVTAAPPPAAQEAAVPVSVARVVRAKVHDEIPLSGTVTPRRFVRLSPRVDGYVQRVLVEAGDAVEAGDVVVELDRRLAELELARAEAALEEARVRHREAQRRLAEVQQLVASNHIADTEVASAEAEVAIQAAGLQRLRAERGRARELLGRHTIGAPFPGVVSAKLVEAGQWVETSDALIELAEIDHLRVRVPVPQIHFGSVAVGTPVVMRFDALPAVTLEAAVSARVPVGDEVARTFPVLVDIDNRERRFAPGMSVRVHLLANPADTAMVLPLDAVVREPGGGEFVWRVVDRNGASFGERLAVRTGRSVDGFRVEVSAGALGVDDRVVVEGNERLREDQAVEIVEEVRHPS